MGKITHKKAEEFRFKDYLDNKLARTMYENRVNEDYFLESYRSVFAFFGHRSDVLEYATDTLFESITEFYDEIHDEETHSVKGDWCRTYLKELLEEINKYGFIRKDNYIRSLKVDIMRYSPDLYCLKYCEQISNNDVRKFIFNYREWNYGDTTKADFYDRVEPMTDSEIESLLIELKEILPPMQYQYIEFYLNGDSEWNSNLTSWEEELILAGLRNSTELFNN